jgi:hypothetical protein
LQPDLHTTVFWERLAPQLTINEYTQSTRPITPSREVLRELSCSIDKDSYFQLSSLFATSEIDAIRNGVFALIDNGLPPVFIYIYYQPWALFDKLHPVIQLFLGNTFSLLPNLWAWYIPPTKGALGWPAHTDCSAVMRFESIDGGTTLMSMSLWIPLTNATLENGCMAVLPRSREVLYDPTITDSTQIRSDDAVSLPAKAGQFSDGHKTFITGVVT